MSLGVKGVHAILLAPLIYPNKTIAFNSSATNSCYNSFFTFTETKTSERFSPKVFHKELILCFSYFITFYGYLCGTK